MPIVCGGGEPSARQDLEEILAHAVTADLYTHLVTAALPLTPNRLEELARIGLRSVQVSIQDAAEANDLFTELMGDVVAPRKRFIQAYARSVQNLDV